MEKHGTQKKPKRVIENRLTVTVSPERKEVLARLTKKPGFVREPGAIVTALLNAAWAMFEAEGFNAVKIGEIVEAKYGPPKGLRDFRAG